MEELNELSDWEKWVVIGKSLYQICSLYPIVLVPVLGGVLFMGKKFFELRESLAEGGGDPKSIVEDWECEQPKIQAKARGLFGKFDRVDTGHKIKESGGTARKGETARNTGKHGHYENDNNHYPY